MLASMLPDPKLGPVVLFAQKGDRRPDEVAPEEARWLMAANMLQFLELGGPGAVREQLSKLRRAAREDIVRAASESGDPARETLEEFRILVAEPILSRSAPSGPPHLRADPGRAVPPDRGVRRPADSLKLRRELSGRCSPSGR